MGLTLDLYVARRMAGAALGALATAFLLIVLVDLVELIGDNAAGRASLAALLGLALLHAPSLALVAAPFAMLIAALFCFVRLARSSELTVIRASGVSLWRLLMPAALVAATAGALATVALQPLAAAFAARYETVREHYFGTGGSRITVSPEGLWLRQAAEDGQTVIRARRVVGSVARLSQVSVFRFDADDRLADRIEARAAVLEPGAWRLAEARIWDIPPLVGPTVGEAAVATRARGPMPLRLPTDLTEARIEESFAAPETISFWKLRGFAALLERAGFSASRHRLHFQELLAQPVVFLAMVLIGAGFAVRRPRRGGFAAAALGCALTGFAYFSLADVARALANSDTVPPEAAAWTLPAAALLAALGLLLHLEES